MKKAVIGMLIFLSGNLFAQLNENNPEITETEIYDHINYLASDDLEGRFSGSEGNILAGEYIMNEFVNNGLKPLFGESYFQDFDFIEDVVLNENNSAAFYPGQKEMPLEIDRDFAPLAFTGNSNLESQLVFAGYGISASKLNYDDYSNLDVTGKFVIVMRQHPEHDSSNSEFEDYASLRNKASVARDKGASGIIFVNGFYPEDDEDKLMEFKYDRGPGVNDLSIIHIKREIVDSLFKSESRNFQEVQKQIDESKTPLSFEFNTVRAKIQTGTDIINSKSRNIGGYFEGNDPKLKNQFIVLGAHYDHLGYGKVGSLYRGEGEQIHNGADDNASGTSGILELIEKFAQNKNLLQRSIIFVCFSGEELGLLGSNYLVNNSPVSTDSMIAMINMDMIGRLNDENTLNIIGSGTSPGFEEILKSNNHDTFNLSFTDDGFGGSDHQSFTIKQIPVLFFFTGTHSDYHKPSDDVEKININGEKKILDFVYNVSLKIDQEPSRPEYIAVKRPEVKGGRMSSKVYVGTVPEFGYQGDGFKMSGVSDGSPAQTAGLQGGDIMIKFGAKTIQNIYDYMYAMGEYSPGDTVDVVVKRENEELTIPVKLGSR